jgi:hypothetical protein
LVPGLIVHDTEPDADEMALERLALWALRRYGPIVAPIRRMASSSTRPAPIIFTARRRCFTEMVERDSFALTKEAS